MNAVFSFSHDTNDGYGPLFVLKLRYYADAFQIKEGEGVFPFAKYLFRFRSNRIFMKMLYNLKEKK